MRSTDGGLTWAIGGSVPATPQLDDGECEPALLRNGSILLNMRAGPLRLVARSDDAGHTFVDAHPAPGLSPVANCQGSTAASASGDGTLLFTAPAGSNKRKNLSLAVSSNGGTSWEYVQVVHAGPSAYSSLAPTSAACTAVLFEGGAAIAEATNTVPSHYQHIFYASICARES